MLCLTNYSGIYFNSKCDKNKIFHSKTFLIFLLKLWLFKQFMTERPFAFILTGSEQNSHGHVIICWGDGSVSILQQIKGHFKCIYLLLFDLVIITNCWNVLSTRWFTKVCLCLSVSKTSDEPQNRFLFELSENNHWMYIDLSTQSNLRLLLLSYFS